MRDDTILILAGLFCIPLLILIFIIAILRGEQVLMRLTMMMWLLVTGICALLFLYYTFEKDSRRKRK